MTLLDQLATYVSVNSKGDMNAFMSSGFTPKSTAKTKTPPVSETIKKIVPAPLTGQMLVYCARSRMGSDRQADLPIPADFTG